MSLEFRNVSHAFGSSRVLKDVSLEAKPGEITCLLGPSGSGKSTLLRLAAGLEKLQAGEVLIAGKAVAGAGTDMSPEKRPTGLLFQDYALFPHLSVAANIAFGLKGESQGAKAARIAELLQSIGLAGFEKRYPHTLSGGQQQRIALARALAPRPQVLLMDEPFASIDSTLRRSLREATRLLLRASQTVVLMVTHDPEEALEMADTIAVLDTGEIVQAGSPNEVYEQSATKTVAALFGGAQILPGIFQGAHVDTDYGALPLPRPAPEGEPTGQKVELVVRPRGLTCTIHAGSDLIVKGSEVCPRVAGKHW